MKNLVIIGMIAVGLVGCSKDKDKGSCSNAVINYKQKVEVVAPVVAKGQLLEIAPSAVSNYNTMSANVVTNSGIDISFDESDTAGISGTIDFENKKLKMDSVELSFVKDEKQSKSRGRSVYEVNSAEMLALARKHLKAESLESEDMQLCSVEATSGRFIYGESKPTLGAEFEFKFSVKFTQEALDNLKDISDAKKRYAEN